MQAEKWDDALAIYQKLWAEERTYDVALSLGQVELNLKKYRDAAEHLEFGIRNMPPREEAAVSERARRMLDLARKEVGSLVIRVDRTNADVRIDGNAVGKSPLPPEVFVEPGSHSIEAEHEGSTPIRQMVTAIAGRQITMDLAFGDPSALSPPPAKTTPEPGEPLRRVGPAPPPEQPAPAPGAEASSSGARTAVLVGGLAVTVVATAATITFALEGASASSDADDARAHAEARFGSNPCASPAGAASSECSDLSSALDRRASSNRIANLSLLVGVVAGISTATAFVLWPSARAGSDHAVRWVPVLDRNAAGAFVNGSF